MDAADAASVQKELQAKLTSCPTTWPRPLESLPGVDQQVSRLHNVLRQCLKGHHNQTCFIVGPAGCGKNLLLKHCIRTLSKDVGPHKLRVAYLHGSTAVDDGSVERSVLRSLLEDGADAPPGKRLRNCSSTFESIRTVLDAEALTLVLRIHHVDFLCRRCTRTLYSLADLVHSKFKSNIIILGTSCSLNVVESMDKRVKSRLNAQTILLSHLSDWPTLRAALLPYLTSDATSAHAWNAAVRDALASNAVHARLQWPVWLGRPFQHYKSVLFGMICGGEFPSLVSRSAATDIEAALAALPWAVSSALALSKPAACLLIAFARLDEIAKASAAESGHTFRAAWDMYTMRLKTPELSHFQSEVAALDVFVRLMDAGFLQNLHDPRRCLELPLTHQAVHLTRDRTELKAQLNALFPELDSFWNQHLAM